MALTTKEIEIYCSCLVNNLTKNKYELFINEPKKIIHKAKVGCKYGFQPIGNSCNSTANIINRTRPNQKTGVEANNKQVNFISVGGKKWMDLANTLLLRI